MFLAFQNRRSSVLDVALFQFVVLLVPSVMFPLASHEAVPVEEAPTSQFSCLPLPVVMSPIACQRA